MLFLNSIAMQGGAVFLLFWRKKPLQNAASVKILCVLNALSMAFCGKAPYNIILVGSVKIGAFFAYACNIPTEAKKENTMRSYTFETQKKTFSLGVNPTHAEKGSDFSAQTSVLLVRTRVPFFSPTDEQASNGLPLKAEKAFCEKINRLYAASAEKFLRHVPVKVVRKAARFADRNGRLPSLVWHCEVPYNGESVVSLFTDISGFDGRKSVKRRVCALWSVEKNALLSPKNVFYTGQKQKNAVIRRLCDIAENNLSRRLFTYYDNFEAILQRSFSFASFYFVPNGVAFCFDGGVLNAHSEEVSVFVVPFEELGGILKTVPDKIAEPRYK